MLDASLCQFNHMVDPLPGPAIGSIEICTNPMAGFKRSLAKPIFQCWVQPESANGLNRYRGIGARI